MSLRDKRRMDFLSLVVRPGECLMVATGDSVVTIYADGESLRSAVDKAMRLSRKPGKGGGG